MLKTAQVLCALQSTRWHPTSKRDLGFSGIVPRSCETDERQQTVNVENPEVTVIPNNHRDSQSTDSDSDGPILYKDDDEEEDDEDDEYTSS